MRCFIPVVARAREPSGAAMGPVSDGAGAGGRRPGSRCEEEIVSEPRGRDRSSKQAARLEIRCIGLSSRSTAADDLPKREKRLVVERGSFDNFAGKSRPVDAAEIGLAHSGCTLAEDGRITSLFPDCTALCSSLHRLARVTYPARRKSAYRGDEKVDARPPVEKRGPNFLTDAAVGMSVLKLVSEARHHSSSASTRHSSSSFPSSHKGTVLSSFGLCPQLARVSSGGSSGPSASPTLFARIPSN
mmetsp:Transcript_15908/g.39876  ORF Transcript_15908/g.39876 Transcript_15908/m.39876 type:complete len:244 (-) Transcript_15908:1253-1984(-)